MKASAFPGGVGEPPKPDPSDPYLHPVGVKLVPASGSSSGGSGYGSGGGGGGSGGGRFTGEQIP